MKIRSSVTWTVCRVLVSCLVAAPGAALWGADTVTLRVDDVRAEPGGTVAVVVRTYAPRGMEQGQICFTAQSAVKSATLKSTTAKSATSPFVELVAVEVSSGAGDATNVAAFDEIAQTALVQFVAPSGTINEADGPLVTFHLRLSKQLHRQEFRIDIDAEDTLLFGNDGEELDLELRSGRLEVRPAGDPLRLEIRDERVEPGETANLAVESGEPTAIIGGEVAYTFDPAFAAGPISVSLHPQATATYTLDTSTAGRAVVSFKSPDATLNAVAGELFILHLPTPPDLPYGSRTDVVLDPAATYMIDAEGRWVSLELTGGELRLDP